MVLVRFCVPMIQISLVWRRRIYSLIAKMGSYCVDTSSNAGNCQTERMNHVEK